MNATHSFNKVSIITSVFLFFLAIPCFPFLSIMPIFQQEYVLEFYGKTKFNGKSVEDVTFELKKNGLAIKSLKTGRNGKFEFEIPISTVNENNEYIIIVSKKGFLTKKISVNTFISEKVITENKLNRFQCQIIELAMIEFAENDIILVNPSAKFKWDNSLKEFSVETEYAKTAKKEEQLLLESPLKYSEYIESKKPGKPTEQTPKKEKVNNVTVKEKEKITDETDKMIEAKTVAGKIVKENLDTKNTKTNRLEEAVGNKLQLHKMENDSTGKVKKEIEDAEIVLKIKTQNEIKKSLNPLVAKEKEKEKEMKVNKDAKYSGNNSFSRVGEAFGEEELKKKESKSKKK